MLGFPPLRYSRALGFVLCTSLASALFAQARDPAAAEALFRQGREASDRGDHAAACEKFRESHRLDAAIGTLFNIGDCEEQLGHLATAWTTFQEVAQRLPPDDERHAIAKQRVAALETRLPRLTVRLDDGAPGAVVTRDGVALGGASLDTPLPVDPGSRTVVVSAPGHADASFEITMAEGASEVLVVRPGKAIATSGGGELEGGARGGSSPTAGWIVGGVGVAGVAVGAITGAMVLGKKSTVDENCDARKVCNAEGADAADAGRTLGVVSTTGFVFGALGIGIGAYLLLSSDDSGNEETVLVPSLGPRSAAVDWIHRF